MNVAPISYITTCKGRLNHIKSTIPSVLAACTPRDQYVLLDSDCPDHAADWIDQMALAPPVHPTVSTVRTGIGDNGIFNLATARNLGAAQATGEFLIFIDADVVLGKTFRANIRDHLAGGNVIIAENRIDDLAGFIIVHRDDFENSGGFDPALATRGGSDTDLILRLHHSGHKILRLPHGLVIAIPHSNEIRGRHIGGWNPNPPEADIMRKRWGFTREMESFDRIKSISTSMEKINA